MPSETFKVSSPLSTWNGEEASITCKVGRGGVTIMCSGGGALFGVLIFVFALTVNNAWDGVCIWGEGGVTVNKNRCRCTYVQYMYS